MSPPSRNAPANSIVTKPCAQATIVRAPSSATDSPASRAIARTMGVAQHGDRRWIRVGPGRQVGEQQPVAVRVAPDEGAVFDGDGAQVRPRIVGLRGARERSRQVGHDALGDGAHERGTIGTRL